MVDDTVHVVRFQSVANCAHVVSLSVLLFGALQPSLAQQASVFFVVVASFLCLV